MRTFAWAFLIGLFSACGSLKLLTSCTAREQKIVWQKSVPSLLEQVLWVAVKNQTWRFPLAKLDHVLNADDDESDATANKSLVPSVSITKSQSAVTILRDSTVASPQ